jgi:hypothetical protein
METFPIPRSALKHWWPSFRTPHMWSPKKGRQRSRSGCVLSVEWPTYSRIPPPPTNFNCTDEKASKLLLVLENYAHMFPNTLLAWWVSMLFNADFSTTEGYIASDKRKNHKPTKIPTGHSPDRSLESCRQTNLRVQVTVFRLLGRCANDPLYLCQWRSPDFLAPMCKAYQRALAHQWGTRPLFIKLS